MVKIIGAGLAGSEAAYFLANQGIPVKLYEMRPKKMTPVHQTGHFAELVCSNSFRSNDIKNAVGLLKEEMRQFNSLIMHAADHNPVPAGSSLAVDRDQFSLTVTEKINNHPLIEVIHEEVTEIDFDTYTMIAAGPLASDPLFTKIQSLFSRDHLHFFDAVAPIIQADSIDQEICYLKSRYDKGEAAYLNCPLTKEEYLNFYETLKQSDLAEVKDFEQNIFEGCMPIEVMADRGIDTLRFGPLKPVGLEREGHEKPYAVVQLRQDDFSKTMYNIVGFQTHLTWPAQKRLIQMIPGLSEAKILRYGVMHRNTYIKSPEILNDCFQTKSYPKLFFAGQISGVEGYVESAASGLNAALQIANLIHNEKQNPLPRETMMGAMAAYVSTPNHNFVPMNANFGLLPPLEDKHRKDARRSAYTERALYQLKKYLEENAWITSRPF